MVVGLGDAVGAAAGLGYRYDCTLIRRDVKRFLTGDGCRD
jgi:hypothetical protein